MGCLLLAKNALLILRLLGLVNNRKSLARHVLDGSISEEARIEGEYSTDVNRWDEKAGLRTGCCTLPSYRRAQGTDKKETGNEEG
jgi:hypothetical protein